jgi:dihydrofolate synthase / folylpolyglutamate synthase
LTSDSLEWLFGLERLGMKFGLENMSKLMAELGHPHNRFPSVLIAGTNGKGSVTAMVDAAMRAAGFRSARYTSPHLLRLEERFVIDGREVDTAALEAAIRRVRGGVDALMKRGNLEAPATFFECTTAAAFELFASSALDLAVLEVGLGGRLDATNVVTPLVCAITTIDLDHQAQLGSTITSIAEEKAGIIKPNVPVVTGPLPPEADVVIERVARQAGSRVIRAKGTSSLADGIDLALAGAHQRDNAVVAVAVLQVLRDLGFAVGDSAVRHALTTVQWPGRLERFRRPGCDVLLDAAHNPAGARALAAYLADIGWTNVTLVFGAMSDKDIDGMLRALGPAASRIICTTAATARAARAADLAAIASGVAGTRAVDVIEDPALALADACSTSHRVVAAGSMFLIGPLRGILR